MTSRRVALTAAFLALAAGGTAACDRTSDDDYGTGYPDPLHDTGYDDAAEPVTRPAATPSRTPPRTPRPRRPTKPPPPDDVFYCADADGVIVDDWYCDEDEPEFYDPSVYYLWHSTGYRGHWVPGDHLPGGRRIAVDDDAARKRAGLPATGFVGNGSVKTNIVGRSSGSSGWSGDGYSSGG